ncbi:MAG: acyl-CoA dehydrogenase [Actinomycetia bacterium]|nr:acyl-CoA dehydrogenase [Actinomycetes bacterium]
MKLVYSEDQAAYRDAVRRFVERELRPLVEGKYDFSRPQTRQDVANLRADLAQHEIATEAPLFEDGSIDHICFCIFIEEISRVNIGLASLAGALFFPVWDMVDLLDEQQRERFGHLFAPGEIVSMGLSEPNAGSNPSQIETVARRVDDGWIISGRKLWTSHAQIASGILVAARKIDGDDRQVSLFMVDRQAQDYEVRTIPTLGMHATSTCEVAFDDMWVPADAEMTPGKGGLASALNLVEQARLKMVFMAVGLAQAALDLAVQYAKDRSQFGKPIGSFQLVQGMLADMAVDLEAARLLGYRAASLYEAGLPARSAMSMAKSYATEMAVRVTSLGIQVHGGIGLTQECNAERYFRDARMLTIPDGTTQIHQLVIGRELTGLSAFS